MKGRKAVVLGLIIGGAGLPLLLMGQELVAKLGLGMVVCGGGYVLIGALQMITKR